MQPTFFFSLSLKSLGLCPFQILCFILLFVVVGTSPTQSFIKTILACRYGGWDGTKWLSDVYVLDTSTYNDHTSTCILSVGIFAESLYQTDVTQKSLLLFHLVHIYNSPLSAVSLEWRLLPLSGPSPAPRCGHSATMVEKRMLIFGGRGPILCVPLSL